MFKLPTISKLPDPPKPKWAEPDVRVRTKREEVLAGLDDCDRLFQVFGKDFAVGPMNLRYSTQALEALAHEGVVGAHDTKGKVWTIEVFKTHWEKLVALPESVDDEGTPGNGPSSLLIWRRI